MLAPSMAGGPAEEAAIRGVQTGWKGLVHQLKGFYGRWAGELRYIENPPKSMGRKWRGRDAFEAAADERLQRAEHLREALPHIEYVIRLIEPEWRPEMAKLVRPSRGMGQRPPIGWAEAGLNVLEEATGYMTVGEMVEEIADRYDEVDLAPVGARQNAAIALSATLLRTYRHLLVSDGDGGWALAKRVGVTGAEDD